MLQSLVFSLVLFISSAFSVTANDTSDKNYFTISSVEVKEIEVDSNDDLIFNEKLSAGEIGEVIAIIDALIAVGKKVYPIIEAGKPIINSQLPVTHVIPNNTNGNDFDFTLSQMENWKMPKSKSYEIVYKNVYGFEVISFTYTIHFQYGGSFEGAGKYLTGVFVSASNLYVSWGFEFSATTEIVSLTNHGTLDNPVAGLTLKLDWVAKNVLNESRSSRTFHVNGNGEFQFSL